MENLKNEGYVLYEDKTNGLDENHVKEILRNHALLHAKSYHLLQTTEFETKFPNVVKNNFFASEKGDTKKGIFPLF